jgi:hypothetical protein
VQGDGTNAVRAEASPSVLGDGFYAVRALVGGVKDDLLGAVFGASDAACTEVTARTGLSLGRHMRRPAGEAFAKTLP